MSNPRQIFAACMITLVFFTCVQQAQAASPGDYLKTASGLQYKIVPGQGGTKAKTGDIIKFRFKYTLTEKDSVLQSSFINLPSYSKVDSGQQVVYSFMEIVPKMSAGDSAIVLISIDSLVSKHIIPNYTPTMQKGNSITCQLKLLQIFATDSLVSEDYNNEINKEKDREMQDLQAYMDQHNMKGMKVGNGVFVMLENAGDTTMKAVAGTTASVKYKGYLLDGKVFDTNMDSSKGHTDPIDVKVGEQGIIEGWGEALPYFGKGAKGKILIPAMMAYGPQPMGEDIPAYSNLIFDMEVIDITKQPTDANN